MKKRILALLLAGVLATSLVACVGGGENDPDDETVDTENESSTDDEYTPSEDDLEADDFWVEETETVYTHSTAYLREEPDGSSDSITTIALRCGFSDSNYFKDSFKKKYGVTPRTYRKLP